MKLPIGIEDFEEIRTSKYYYVDKTGLIIKLLENMGKVNLFTRPRRFGKTLNMSMLQYFFEIGSDSTLFDGLEISGEKELCEEYRGKFPVISVSLKGVSGTNFEEAKSMLRDIIGREALRFQFLMESDKLTEFERQQYKAVLYLDEKGVFAMEDEMMKNSLQTLSQLLHKHYQQKVVILTDEYDVPLDRSYRLGYYGEMVELLRSLFGQALKTNKSLNFAVLTGCLRISKESIFTGLNNFRVYTVKDVRYNEYFGFTDQEVKDMLEYYGMSEQYDAIKEWYDGYKFGDLGIYCPWDVINYCEDIRDNSVKAPRNYWVNTSSNDIIRMFVHKADAAARNEIELLVNGGSICKMVRQELTYRDLDSDIENLWSILYTTGYLTQGREREDDMTELVIPNKEIHWIFTEQIREWFKEETKKDAGKLESFCRAFRENDVSAIEEGFTAYLGKTISIRDTYVRKERKENFYHGILLGLLGAVDGWIVKSSMESGEKGILANALYSDIAIKDEVRNLGIVIELKYAENAAFDAGCEEAMRQIKEKNMMNRSSGMV